MEGSHSEEVGCIIHSPTEWGRKEKKWNSSCYGQMHVGVSGIVLPERGAETGHQPFSITHITSTILQLQSTLEMSHHDPRVMYTKYELSKEGTF